MRLLKAVRAVDRLTALGAQGVGGIPHGFSHRPGATGAAEHLTTAE